MLQLLLDFHGRLPPDFRKTEHVSDGAGRQASRQAGMQAGMQAVKAGRQAQASTAHALDELGQERHWHAVCIGRGRKLGRIDVCVCVDPQHT